MKVNELIERFVFAPHEVRLISGHKDTLILERVYDARDPAKLNERNAQLDNREKHFLKLVLGDGYSPPAS